MFHVFICAKCEDVEFSSDNKAKAMCFVCGELGKYKYPSAIESHPKPQDEEEVEIEEEAYPHGPIEDYV